jgi:molecular chaperone DnaK
MVRDAELHAAEDHKRRETADARNQLDSLVYQTEKSLKEHGGDLDASTRSNIEQALERAKKELEGQDAAAMKSAVEELSKASHKLAEAIYAKASQQQAGQGPQPGAGAGAGDTTGDGQDRGRKEDVVDADFEEVKGS